MTQRYFLRLSTMSTCAVQIEVPTSIAGVELGVSLLGETVDTALSEDDAEMQDGPWDEIASDGIVAFLVERTDETGATDETVTPVSGCCKFLTQGYLTQPNFVP